MQKQLSKEVKAVLGGCVSFSQGTSRGRDTYGYNVVTLKFNGTKQAQTCGGGYDMQGTCLGEFIEKAFPVSLSKLASKRAGTTTTQNEAGRYSSTYHTNAGSGNMSNWTPNPNFKESALVGLTFYTHDKTAGLDGGCGFSAMQEVLKALGVSMAWKATSKKDGFYILVEA